MAGPRTLALIGAGRMGSALATGWIAESSKLDLTIVDPEPSSVVRNWAASGDVSLNSDVGVVDIVVVAVKPQIFSKMAADIKPWIGPDTLVVSIMAGVTIKQLKSALEAELVIRAMPNTPGAIGRGITVLSAPTETPARQLKTVRDLLQPLGQVEGPVDEAKMPAVTGVSGSGPAYLFLLTEVMAYAGEAEGLDRDLAMKLAKATVEGAAALQASSNETPGDLREAVTSPGGTTRAALDILMSEAGLPALMRKAVQAAAARERDLSRERD